jgi:hypothetical protein
MEKTGHCLSGSLRGWVTICLVSMALAGCGGGSSPGAASPAQSGQSQISGTPPTNTRVGEAYSFTPMVAGTNGDNLTFSIQNQPAWTTFNAVTGSLSGVAAPSDVGTYSNIIITVSDGQFSTSLAAFAITVNQIGIGSATISWLPPTERTDGSALTNLAGFRIYYGQSTTALDHIETVTNAGLTSYMVQNLSAATWYFVVRAYTADGVESESSNIASKTIQ